jgi:hypothetical protein
MPTRDRQPPLIPDSPAEPKRPKRKSHSAPPVGRVEDQNQIELFPDLPTLPLPVPPPPEAQEPYHGRWRGICQQLAARSKCLQPWEQHFVSDLPRFPRISTRQRYTLKVIAERVLKDAG